MESSSAPYLDGLPGDRIHDFFCGNSHPQSKISHSLSMAFNGYWYSAHHHVSIAYGFYLPGQRQGSVSFKPLQLLTQPQHQTPTCACHFPDIANKIFLSFPFFTVEIRSRKNTGEGTQDSQRSFWFVSLQCQGWNPGSDIAMQATFLRTTPPPPPPPRPPFCFWRK